MDINVKLSKREEEIAEFFAWGASTKDIATRLYLSARTVENHARKIYEKIGCSKVNELSAWWFCTHFQISFSLSPLKRSLVALSLLAILLPMELMAHNSDQVRRGRRGANTRVASRRARSRRSETDFQKF